MVPGKALDEVTRLASETANRSSIGLSENQIVFEFGEHDVCDPEDRRQLPELQADHPEGIRDVHRDLGEELAAAVKRVSLMALHNSPLKLSINVADQTLSLSATTQDVGDASEDLMVKTEGEDVEIAFNHSFLMDGLNSAGSETVRIEIKDHEKPGS